MKINRQFNRVVAAGTATLSLLLHTSCMKNKDKEVRQVKIRRFPRVAVSVSLLIGSVFASPAFAVTGKVTVPSNYIYNPRLGSLHDYCTSSPDEFPNAFGANADFRGPCARHDLCYGSSTDKKVCDVNLWRNMLTNCNYYYSWYNPVRKSCYNTAHIYFIAVVGAS